MSRWLYAVLSMLAVAFRLSAADVRQYRVQHEAEILAEYTGLLAIPNLASDRVNIERNATAIAEMFRRRGATAQFLRVEGAPPIVFVTISNPRAKNTIALYAHYDGQPVDPAQWTTPPWQPVIREGSIYARSASDDKAPIMAMAAALDALRAGQARPPVLRSNIKLIFEGEEEAGSPHLPAYFAAYPNELAADAYLICDGPVHQSRRMQIYFGARGVTDVELTVYGPQKALHSGHYGNWAPNPIVALTHLIDSMRDTDARILIKGFYDDVAPLTEAERAAVAAMPDFDSNLRTDLAIGRTEGSGKPLNEQILAPALNLRGIAAGHVGEQAANAIPTEARASIDFRLVPNQTPEKVHALVEQHIAAQGFFIVRDRPDAATRAAHANVVKVAWGPGYPAARTAMDLPISRRVAEIVAKATGSAPLLLPSLGGSVPMYLFRTAGTPAIGLPIVNHDNNQHAANENLRVQNLWDGIEIFAALFRNL